MSAEGLSGADLRLSQVHVADRLSIPALTTYSTSSDVPHAARFPMRNDCCPQMDEEPPKGWTRWNQKKKSDYISKISLQRARAAAKPAADQCRHKPTVLQPRLRQPPWHHPYLLLRCVALLKSCMFLITFGQTAEVPIGETPHVGRHLAAVTAAVLAPTSVPGTHLVTPRLILGFAFCAHVHSACVGLQNYYKTVTLFSYSKSIGVFNVGIGCFSIRLAE